MLPLHMKSGEKEEMDMGSIFCQDRHINQRDLQMLVTIGGGILRRAGAGVVLQSEFIETITKDPVKGGPRVSWKIRGLPLL